MKIIKIADVSGGTGLISQALLANADALCAAVSPLMDPDETLMLVTLKLTKSIVSIYRIWN